MQEPKSSMPFWLTVTGALLALVALCLPASSEIVSAGDRCCVKAHLAPPGSGCTLPCDPINDCSGGGQGVPTPGECKDKPGTCNDGSGLTTRIRHANYTCEEYDCNDGGVECKWKKLADLTASTEVAECTGGCKVAVPGDPQPL